ncbi:UNVERIFIED_CONTAM: hypothetical protein LK11_12680 [Mumia flava]
MGPATGLDDVRRMHRVRASVLAGRRPEAAPRPLVQASWRRMRSLGVSADGTAANDPLDAYQLEDARHTSALGPMLDRLRTHLRGALEDANMLMVVADTEDRVLWRDGPSVVKRQADALGFVPGSSWSEATVGTNAIGTCSVEQTPVHIHAAEHFAETHTVWTCNAAPLTDPVTGQHLGVVNISARSPIPNPLALTQVALAASLAENELRVAHHERMHRLRNLAAPLLARVDGPALAVTQDGVCAAVSSMAEPGRIELPKDMTPGELLLPNLGHAIAEALPGGWLLRLDDTGTEDTAPTALHLDLSVHPATVEVAGPSSSWKQVLSPRHAEIIVALVRHPEGRTASALADDLFADAARTVTVRAEMSRLRRTLGPVLATMPYRFADHVSVRLTLPDDPSALLPVSSAPAVAALRTDLAGGDAPAAAPGGRHRAY